MAREYGKFFTSTWGDPDFRALRRAAQHLYMQLISQPDLSMAGVLTIAPVRWAQQSGSTEAEVMDALATLTESRFAYVDQETQELLVRSYVRRDEGWKSPTTMKAIASAMTAVLSPGLKMALAEEVRRIDTGALSEKISEKTGRSTKEVVMGYIGAFLDSVIPHPIPHAIPHPKGYPMGINEDLHTTETATATAPAPEPATAPAPATSSSSIAPRSTADVEPDPYLFIEFWAQYPRKVGKQAARRAWGRAIKKANPDDIVLGAGRYARDPNLPPEQYIPHPEKWLNDGRWGDGPLPDRNPRERTGLRVATADQRFTDGQALAAKLAAEEAQQNRLEIEA